MRILKSLLFLRLASVLILGLEIAGFFYFEPSILLRILVILLGLIGIWQLNRLPETLILTMLYLGLYDFYNIRYGLAIPMALILLGVLALTIFLFYLQSRIHKYEESTNNDILLVYLFTLSLVVLEIFLTMSLWPVDPKTKSLVIVIIYYLASRLISLNIYRVLSLKRAFGFLLVSLLILGVVITLSWYLGF